MQTTTTVLQPSVIAPDYEKWADACRAVAAAMTDTAYATMFVEMASTWLALAERDRPGAFDGCPVSSILPPELRRRLH